MLTIILTASNQPYSQSSSTFTQDPMAAMAEAPGWVLPPPLPVSTPALRRGPLEEAWNNDAVAPCCTVGYWCLYEKYPYVSHIYLSVYIYIWSYMSISFYILLWLWSHLCTSVSLVYPESSINATELGSNICIIVLTQHRITIISRMFFLSDFSDFSASMCCKSEDPT